MLILGLTGGIASGKTAVAKLFTAKGYSVLDCDGYAREVVSPGKPAWQEIRDTFGETYFQADGSLHRRRLGERVFNDPVARKRLNDIVHPRVLALVGEGIKAASCRQDSLVIVDMPLLFEIGYDKHVDITVVVSVSPEVQVQRLCLRDGLSTAEAAARIAAQMPLVEKVKKADHTIDNSGTLADTEQQVDSLLAAITQPQATN